MSRAPLRFLLLVLGLWIGVRAAILLPEWSPGFAPIQEAAAAQPSRVAAVTLPATQPSPRVTNHPPPVLHVAGHNFRRETPMLTGRGQTVAVAAGPRAHERAVPLAPPVHSPPVAGAAQYPAFPPSPPGPARAASSRWSISVWLLVRDESAGPALAPGGTLGGSQAGARVTYALGGGFALSGGAYLPLRRTAGAEAAAGIDWRPLPALPLNLLAERRQRLGKEGRNAFALTVYGGTSRTLSRRLRLDAYGQAGIVGLQSRDLFVDGSVRLAHRLGPVELGAGAWGAAQPGAARLDAGPSLAWRLPIAGANLRLQADWRFRLAGEAAPRSGPALTLATDF